MTSKTTTATNNASIQSPVLQGLVKDIEQINTATQALFTALSPTQLTWKPHPREWSATECFDHLVVTGNLYYPRIGEAIARAQAQGKHATGSYRPSLFARLFIGSLGPNTPVKVKTFPMFKPAATVDPSIQHTFLAQQYELVGLVKQADAVDLNTVKLASPLTRLLQLSIGEALVLQVVHQQTHLKQAQHLRTLAHFPPV